jgi:hypothetical protein
MFAFFRAPKGAYFCVQASSSICDRVGAFQERRADGKIQLQRNDKGMIMSAIDEFERLKKQPFIADDTPLLKLFDSLDPVTSHQILAKWRGSGFDTGHWLLPVLADMKWSGKWLLSEFDVKPLICLDDKGRLFSNQSLNGEASLLMMEFRGKVSATVAYDGVPMFGHLRRINERTLLGVVNGKSLGAGKAIVPDGKHQYFYLERVDEWPAEFVEAA